MLLEEGVDYGRVPGIDRPFLQKPGAEKFEKAYGYAISYEIERKIGDGDATPALEYIVHAKVHLGDTEGPVVAEGVGSCNTHESKYRFRQAKHTCPDCGKGTVIKGRADGRLKGKWWCATGQGGCGHTFDPGDRRLTEQVVGQVENENPYDLANTIVKMARKRAGVDAILTATGTSGLFSQDDDSPTVQRDAQAKTESSGQARGQAADQSSASATAGGRSTVLPRMPKADEISEDTFLDKVALTDFELSLGRVPFDGLMRQTEAGPVLAVTGHMGQTKVPQVSFAGDIATALNTFIEGKPERLDKAKVFVAGDVWAVPWEKDGEAKPPMKRLVVVAMRLGEFRFPPEKAPAQPTEEQAVRAATSEQGAEEVAHELAAAEGPGMTEEAFMAGLESHRIAVAYAASAAKSEFGQKVELASLTDQQRHQLGAGLGLFEQP